MKRIILIITICSNSFIYCQQSVNYNLHYDNSKTEYVPYPVQEMKELARKKENLYYVNKEKLYNLEYDINKELYSLKNDTSNIRYKGFLNGALEYINDLKEKGLYSDYSIVLDDLIQQLRISKLSMKE